MPSFNASFLDRTNTYSFHNYFMYSKELAIRQAKQDADMMHAVEFSMEYRGSGKSVGRWVKKGSRWYKE